MTQKLATWTILLVAFATSVSAHASLIGATVVFTNSAAAGGTFVVGPGIEQQICGRYDGETCVLGTELDYGADYITTRVFNATSTGYDIGVRVANSTFGPGVNIVGIDPLTNTFPAIFDYSFTSNSVGWTAAAFFWAPNSDYSQTVRVRSVPEPGTLSLLAAGLLGLAALRRRRDA